MKGCPKIIGLWSYVLDNSIDPYIAAQHFARLDQHAKSNHTTIGSRSGGRMHAVGSSDETQSPEYLVCVAGCTKPIMFCAYLPYAVELRLTFLEILRRSSWVHTLSRKATLV